MAFLILEWPMRVDEKVVRYYTVVEREAVYRLLGTYGPMAQAMNDSRKLDDEVDMKKEPQKEPEEVEFNLDVCEPFSFHYRGGLPRVFSDCLLTDS